MAYRMAPTVVTLNDFQGHSPVAGLFKCNPSNIYAAFYMGSTDSVLAVHLRQLNFTYESGDYRQENSLFQKHGKWSKWLITIHGRCFSQTYVHQICNSYLQAYISRSSVSSHLTELGYVTYHARALARQLAQVGVGLELRRTTDRELPRATNIVDRWRLMYI